jgi:hypothetical protein
VTVEQEARQRADELLARLGKFKTNGNGTHTVAEQEFDPDLIPEIDLVEFKKSEADLELDNVIDSIDIVEAYERFCGKMTPVVGSKQESIMISCPIPGHTDEHPSAWINSVKKTWFCGTCQSGGDLFDLAAFRFGMPNYKTDGSFPELKKQIAESYGYTYVKGLKKDYVVEPEVIPATIAKVVNLPIPDAILTQQDYDELKIDWESWVPEGTFLRDWLEACTIDDLPHEYYFWLGMQAIAFAARNNVFLRDFIPVKSNINVCLYGSTGVGKTRSINPYISLLEQALPFTNDDPYEDPTGTLILPMPGSAESLIDLFNFEVTDPMGGPVHLAEISGLLKIDELSSFVSKANRMGSSLKETIIELHDVFNKDIMIRSRGAGLATAKNPFCQVVTTTQPRAIGAFLKHVDTETGFLNRWIFAIGKSRKAPIAYGGVAPDLGLSVRSLQSIARFADRRHEYVLTGKALDYWNNFFDGYISPIKTGDVEADSMFSRVDLFLKKFIVLLAINSQETSPSLETVQQACQFFNYLKTSYRLFGSDIHYTETGACQDRILEVVNEFYQKTSKFPTKRDIVRQIGKRFDADVIEKMLKTMLALELLDETPDQKPGRGRPTTRYSVVQ